VGSDHWVLHSKLIYARRGGLVDTIDIKVDFPMLKVLDLCSNEIEDLSFLIFMPSLKHLFLTGNKVKTFEKIPFLEEMEVSSVYLDMSQLCRHYLWDAINLAAGKAFTITLN